MSSSSDIRTFSGEELRTCDTLFSQEIDRDPWIQYHATSSINEERIDREGLRWVPSICSFDEVVDLVVVFRSMNWAGLHGGGCAVLDGFSLCGDFQGESAKPIYFREYSIRTILYSTRDFAGGESARAVRYALRDLDQYHCDEAVRSKHYDDQRRNAIAEVSIGAIPNRVMRIDLEWLKRQIDRFASLKDRCEACEVSHDHGVIYAVRFQPDDLKRLSYSRSMGLRCYKPIAPDRIVAKVHIKTDDVPLPSGNGRDLSRNNQWRHEDPNGLLCALEVAHREGTALPKLDTEATFAHRRDTLLDTAAGVDESEEIARHYGSPKLAEFVKKHRQRKEDSSAH